MFELLKNSIKPDINTIENSVDPDQLASSLKKPADQDPHCFPHNMRVQNNYRIRNTELYQLS